MSLADVEEATGMHFSTIARYERNERQPNLDVLRELAELYQVPVSEFFQSPEDLLQLLPPEAAQGAMVALKRPDAAPLFPLLLKLDDRQMAALVEFLKVMLEDDGMA